MAFVFRPEYQLSQSVLDELHRHRVPTIQWVVDYRLWCSAGFFFNPALGEVCYRCARGRHWNAVRYRCSAGSLSLSTLDAAVRLVDNSLLRLDRRADIFVVPTQSTADVLREATGLDTRRVLIIEHPIEDSDFVDAPQPRWDEPFVLFLGRLSPEKGLELLLGALTSVPGLRLEAYALDPLGREGQVREQITSLGLAERVILDTKARFGPALVKRIAESRCVVVPSLWPDTSENVVLESMSLAKPVIVFSGGGNEDLVRRSGGGYVLDRGSRPQLVDALLSVRDSSTDLAARGQLGVAFVKEAFSSSRFDAKIANAIATVIEVQRSMQGR